jgi:hypothetical protein
MLGSFMGRSERVTKTATGAPSPAAYLAWARAPSWGHGTRVKPRGGRVKNIPATGSILLEDSGHAAVAKQADRLRHLGFVRKGDGLHRGH